MIKTTKNIIFQTQITDIWILPYRNWCNSIHEKLKTHTYIIIFNLSRKRLKNSSTAWSHRISLRHAFHEEDNELTHCFVCIVIHKQINFLHKMFVVPQNHANMSTWLLQYECVRCNTQSGVPINDRETWIYRRQTPGRIHSGCTY